ncbi:MAG: mechanosensitive ion channel domain-containing protein [Coleofasciculaceae cyanobacterium]
MPNFISYLLAQPAQEATEETAKQAQELLAEITTWKITQAIIVVIVTYLIVTGIDKVILWLSERVNKEWRLGIKQSLPFWHTFVLAAAAAILLNLFIKLSSNNLLAITGTVAVALGFAFKDYASSVIAGLIGLFEVTYQVGDRVEIEGYYGEIVSYGLRGVRLRTPEDNIVTIPHNKLWTEAVSNANAGQLEAMVVTKFYLAHGVDSQLVTRILYRVALTSKYTQLKMPVVVIMAEKPWGTMYKLKCYPMDARDEFVYQTDLIKRAKQVFTKYGVTYPRIMSQELD